MKNPDSFPYPFLWSGEIPSLLFLYTSGLKNIARLGGASPRSQLLGVAGGSSRQEPLCGRELWIVSGTTCDRLLLHSRPSNVIIWN